MNNEKTNELDLMQGINYQLLEATRKDKGYSFSYMEGLTSVAEGTIKNILGGRTKNPGTDNLKRICKALGIRVQDVIYDANEEKTAIENQGIKDGNVSVIALKEIYETQMAASKQTSEMHIANIRSHYEQHHIDLKENYEKRIEDKDAHISTLKIELKHSRIISWICIVVLVGLLIAEVANPNLGWLRY